MSSTKHTYETTFETFDLDGDIQTGSWEVRIVYNCTPEIPARIRWDENDHPAEDAEVEILNIHEEVTTMAGERRWFDAGPELTDMVIDWAEETLIDDLIENAGEEE